MTESSIGDEVYYEMDTSDTGEVLDYDGPDDEPTYLIEWHTGESESWHSESELSPSEARPVIPPKSKGISLFLDKVQAA